MVPTTCKRPFPQSLSYPGCGRPAGLSQEQLNADTLAFYRYYRERYFRSSRGGWYIDRPDTYQGGIIFRTARVGAFFYVAPALREQAATIMRDNGFRPAIS